MDSLPSRQSTITLQDITADNWELVSRLVVNRDQLGLVPTNMHSLCEHQFVPGSVIRAVYADKVPVGYIRVNVVQKQGLLQCFMIDQKCQGLLFGTRAMILFKQELKDRGMVALTVNTKPFDVVTRKDDSPEHFFTGLDFQSEDEHQLVCVL
ncbi:hypothetical protein BGZ82_006362 [Podila clonocystis]|nr:hypothetical protein BGZ82_006362 [Podila clonocystis]